MTMFDRLSRLATRDVATVNKKNQEYGESWCKRGGQQAFAVIWRKVDRIESILQKMHNGYDIFDAWEKNPGDVRDDIRDLRQYLLLLEEYMEREELTKLDRKGDELPRALVPTRFVDSGEPQAQGYVDQDRLGRQ